MHQFFSPTSFFCSVIQTHIPQCIYWFGFVTFLQSLPVLQSFLFFIILILQKVLVGYSVGYPSIWVCVMFLMIRLMYFWQEHHWSDILPFSVNHIKDGIMPLCLIDDTDFVYLVRVVSVKFLQRKVTAFPFITINVMGGGTPWDYINILFLLKLSSINFSIHW